MLTQTLVMLLMVMNADVQSVTIECPGITCHSRFADSLNKNIVNENDWIHSVSITYLEPDPNQNAEEGASPVWGDTAQLVFKINPDRKPKELAQVLTQSGYYASTEDWTLVERTPFSKLK